VQQVEAGTPVTNHHVNHYVTDGDVAVAELAEGSTPVAA
jgi:hypothetical protein